jgi:hypothetical protein
VQTPVLNGWIYTIDQTGLEDCFDERHPVLILGNPPLLSYNSPYIYNFNNRTSLLVLLLFQIDDLPLGQCEVNPLDASALT